MKIKNKNCEKKIKKFVKTVPTYVIGDNIVDVVLPSCPGLETLPDGTKIGVYRSLSKDDGILLSSFVGIIPLGKYDSKKKGNKR